MTTIAILLILLTLISVATIIAVSRKRIVDRKTNDLKMCEPDLSLRERPDLIAKVPENENRIPDSNASTSKTASQPSRDHKAS